MNSYERYIDKYCNDVIAISGKISPARNQHIKTSLTFLHKLNPDLDWGTMDTSDARAVYSKLLQSPEIKDSTRSLRSRYVLAFFKYLCEENVNPNLDYKKINKLRAHAPPKPVIDELEILTDEQLDTLLSHKLPEEMKVIIAFLFGGGMRISEVLRLRPKDVRYKYEEEFMRDYYSVQVDDQKTQKKRTTFIFNPKLIEIIKNHAEKVTEDDKYFISENGEAMKYSYVRYWMDKEKNYFPKLSSHKGRKYNISHRIANGENISSVCLTTHGSPHSSSINHYLRLNEKDAIKNIMKSN